MIVTVTLNAAVDKTYMVPGFTPGRVYREPQMLVYPGGKGINAARAVKALGCEVTALGFVGGANGLFIERELDKQGVRRDFVHVDGETRLSLNIIDTADGRATELLERGPAPTAEQLDELRARVALWAERARLFIIAGSVPDSVAPDVYAELIRTAQRYGARVLFDSSGDAFAAGIGAKPFFAKPNELEVQRLTALDPANDGSLAAAVRLLHERGIAFAAVSLGAQGAIAGYDGAVYRVRVPRVDAVSAVGCGDSFVAGMAAALLRGESAEECLRCAAAAGTANALSPIAGHIRVDDVRRLAADVEVTRLE